MTERNGQTNSQLPDSGAAHGDSTFCNVIIFRGTALDVELAKGRGGVIC